MTQTSVDKPATERAEEAQLFALANSEYDAGRFLKALELLESLIEKGTASEVVYNNRGAALDALGRNRDAVESYSKAIALNPKYELAWHNLGNSLFLQELYKDAVGAYVKAAAFKPDRRENWTGLASAYIKLGRNKKAKPAIDKLSEFAEKDSSVLLTQADLYMESGYLDTAAVCCKTYISKHPESPEGYARLGSVEHKAEEYGKAIETFEKALKLVPLDKELWNNLGYTYFVAGYLDKAVESFDRALGIDPRYKNAWYNKGYAFHGADRLEEALDCYDKALRLDANDRVLWNNLGNALYNLGRYRDSIPKFVEAIAVDPDYEIAWNNIGNALEKMALYSEAIPYHDRSLEVSPDFDYALYAKGVCRAMMGSHEEGYDLVLESLEINPAYDEAWKAKSKIAGMMGRWDEALVAIEESLALNPEFDQGWMERGEILLAVKDTEAAQASFEMALKCLEDLRTDTVGGLAAMMRRGEILARLGRFEEALANLETVAISGKLDSSSISEALELRRFLNLMELPRAMKAVAESSADPKVRLDYARFLLDSGELQEAERMLNESQAAGNHGPSLRLLKAKMKALQGDLEGALAIVRSDSGTGSDARVFALEGEALESKGDIAEAIAAYKRALDLDPSDLHSAMALARLHMSSGDPSAALSYAGIVVGIDGGDWEAHKIRADALDALGDKQNALSELSEAKSLLARAGLSPEEWLKGGVR